MNNIELINFSEQPYQVEKGMENSRNVEIANNGDTLKAWHSIGLVAKTAMYEFLHRISMGRFDQLHLLESYSDDKNFRNGQNLEVVKNVVKIKALQRTKNINLLKEEFNQNAT
jgi:ketol-acid reductoisomerase